MKLTVIRVLLIEGSVNLFIALIKLAVGLTTQSSVILADSLHSFTDLANNVVAVVASRVSRMPADNDHPYGHEKFEYVAIFFLSILLGVVGIELIFHAIQRHGQPVEQSIPGLILLCGAIVVNLVLSLWEKKQAERLKSNLLFADAAHTFSDVLTSIAVIVGWQLASMGWYWLDTVFCLFVAAIVFKLSWKLFKQALPVLVDEQTDENGLPADTLDKLVKEFSAIQSVTDVRSRFAGNSVNADLTIKVAPSMRVDDAHELVHQFEARLREEIDLNDVIIHIEPDSHR